MDDSRLKVRDLAHMEGILKSAVHRILTEDFEMRKMYESWEPRVFITEQKQHGASCLAIFHSDKAVLRRYITMNETWVHYCTRLRKV